MKDNNSVSALLHLSNSDFLSADFLQLLVHGAKDFAQTKLKIKHSMSSIKRKFCESLNEGKNICAKNSIRKIFLFFLLNHLIFTILQILLCIIDGAVSELRDMLNARTESFGFSAISSIIYNDSPNVSEQMARKCINTLLAAGADVDIPDFRGIINR